ncbi:PAS domain-containing sensor histidine kinase [Georgenia sp. EYE_87]|uniref:ATP-binding protein n=1 Tax=Georgenia sp. EYE_87 TaxID=2853448 RepID=UPI00200385BC|nr:ATP-binding protein [Georgenia sp. EYE_87]MCK6210264.1 PAS domain-containing sensor histidine kinase [Georgenia sp. EYE_87]
MSEPAPVAARSRWRLPSGSGVSPARRLIAAVLVVAGLPLLTVALVAARGELALGSLLLLYLLAVVVVAAVGGLTPGLLAAAISFGLANWFLTPPYHTLVVAERDSVVELVVFVVAAVIVSATVELAARDRVTYQERLAAQAAQTRELAAADRVRTALIAAVGHDLRTPLASAKAAVSTLRQDDVEWREDQRAELLATIEESTDRLSRVITNLLDMSRLQSDALTVRPGPVGLVEVVSRALLSERARAVTTDIPDDFPPAWADAGLLERVVDNLVENALRFSPTGVEITAELDGGAGGGRGERICLRVVDHGPGVPPERWDRMFVPFQRLDDRGQGSNVGLGLAIAQGFTQAMGGSLTPSVTPGGGLTMTVDLEVADR